MELWTVFLLFTISILFLYYICKRDFTFWSSLNIPGPKPYPIIGNLYSFINPGIRQMDIEWINKYGDIVGAYVGSKPVLIIRETELIKQVLVKDFENFTNRRSFLNGTITDKMLTSLVDEDWKRVRAAISPAFSANKLKSMNKGLNDCCKLFIENLSEISKEDEDVEIKDISGSFTMDLIAKTGFGIDVNSQKDKNSPFVKNAKKLFTLNTLMWPFILFVLIWPRLGAFLSKTFKLSFFPIGTLQFFASVVEKAIITRSGHEAHNDLLQLMLTSLHDEDDAPRISDNLSKKETKNKLTKEELVAQGILFILAGFETVSTSLAMFLYCLAENTLCQEKVFEEIERVISNNDIVNYETLFKLPYLNMCMEESLRLYTPASRVDRMVTKSAGVKVGHIHMPQYSVVVVPILSIHYNPEIYPEPEKYIPERFTVEEKANRDVIHYLPFGYGPRNCIAQRLGLVQMKIAAIHVVRNFKLSVSERTKRPITFKNDGRMNVDGGLFLKLTSRIKINKKHP